MKDFIKQLNEKFDRSRSILEGSTEECLKPETPFSVWDGEFDEDEINIDRLYHDADQEELERMGAFDNLNLEEALDGEEISYMTISELLSNMHENVPEEFLDKEIKFFKKLAKVFGTKIYDELIVSVDDGGYDPKYVFSDGIEMPELGENVIYYPAEKMIAENKYGNLYLYFVSEEDCKKYFVMAKKFLTDYEFENDEIQEKMDKENLSYESFTEAVDNVSKEKLLEDIRSEELDQYLKELAKNDYKSGHLFDQYDFEYFKHVCKDDGYDVVEADFDKYFEYFDAFRSCDFDDDCDWFEDDLDEGLRDVFMNKTIFNSMVGVPLTDKSKEAEEAAKKFIKLAILPDKQSKYKPEKIDNNWVVYWNNNHIKPELRKDNWKKLNQLKHDLSREYEDYGKQSSITATQSNGSTKPAASPHLGDLVDGGVAVKDYKVKAFA